MPFRLRLGLSPAPLVAQHRLDSPGHRPGGGPRPTLSAWSSTRRWLRGGSLCPVPRPRRPPTTGGPSHGRPEGGPLVTQTPDGWRVVASSPMALHRGGYAPGLQGRPAHPAVGGEGAAPPHPARVHHQARPGPTPRLATAWSGMGGTGAWPPGPGPPHHGDLGQASSGGHGASPRATPGHYPVAVPALGPPVLGSFPPPPQAGSPGTGRGLGRGTPLGGRGPHDALLGRLADPGASEGSPLVAPRPRPHPAGRPSHSGSWSRTPRTTRPPGWRPCRHMCAPPTSPRIGPALFRAWCSSPAPRRGLPGGGRPPTGCERRLRHVGVGALGARVAAPLRRALRPPRGAGQAQAGEPALCGEESRQAQGSGAHPGAPRRTGGGDPLGSES